MVPCSLTEEIRVLGASDRRSEYFRRYPWRAVMIRQPSHIRTPYFQRLSHFFSKYILTLPVPYFDNNYPSQLSGGGEVWFVRVVNPPVGGGAPLTVRH